MTNQRRIPRLPRGPRPKGHSFSQMSVYETTHDGARKLSHRLNRPLCEIIDQLVASELERQGLVK